MKDIKFLYFVSFIMILQLISSISFPTSLYAKGGSEQESIHITSDQMEALDKEGKVIFKGNVVAKKGELTIYADQLVVYYEENKGKAKNGEKRSLKRLVASGNVRITQGAKSASGEKAVYDKARETITITGNAQVWQGKNRVKGHEIVVYLNEDKSLVESAPGGRVEAVVYTNTK